MHRHRAAVAPSTPIAHSTPPKIFANRRQTPASPIRHPAPIAPDAHRHPANLDAPIRSPPHPTAHPLEPMHAKPTCHPSNTRPTPASPYPRPHHSPRHSRPRQSAASTSARTQEIAISPPPASRSNPPPSPLQIHANHPPTPLPHADTSTRWLPHRESRQSVSCAGSCPIWSHLVATIGATTRVSNASHMKKPHSHCLCTKPARLWLAQ